jgi:O-antigen ligase
LEAALYLVIAGSALAIGAVHPWAYVPLWYAAALTGILVAAHASQLRSLKRQLGPHRFVLRGRGHRMALDQDQPEVEGWRFDLSRPAWPRAALVWPGVAFVAWAVAQVVPLPDAVVHALSPGRGHLQMDEIRRPYPFSIDVAASLRGLAFASSMLLLYLGAASVAVHSGCRRRFRSFIAGLGLVLALLALFQIAVGAKGIYGVFQPVESAAFFGVFVNRNHFAAYMMLCAMAALATLHRSLQSYRRRLGLRSNRRRQIVALGTPEGIRVILAAVPVPITIGALIATTSRGGILAFVGALLLASVAIRGHQQRLPAGIVAFLFVALPLLWFGFERLEDRFGRIRSEESGRTAIWRHSLESMSGTWLTGAGLNTFPEAVSRVLPLSLPQGGAAWPAEIAEAIPAELRIGHRTPEQLDGWIWYREAHNDYVQLAVEMGAIGAAIGIWGLVMLATRMREPWLAAGVVGVLAHSTVDFSLQIPAVAVLFFVVCAYAETTPTRAPSVLRRTSSAAPIPRRTAAPAAAFP